MVWIVMTFMLVFHRKDESQEWVVLDDSVCDKNPVGYGGAFRPFRW